MVVNDNDSDVASGPMEGRTDGITPSIASEDQEGPDPQSFVEALDMVGNKARGVLPAINFLIQAKKITGTTEEFLTDNLPRLTPKDFIVFPDMYIHSIKELIDKLGRTSTSDTTHRLPVKSTPPTILGKRPSPDSSGAKEASGKQSQSKDENRPDFPVLDHNLKPETNNEIYRMLQTISPSSTYGEQNTKNGLYLTMRTLLQTNAALATSESNICELYHILFELAEGTLFSNENGTYTFPNTPTLKEGFDDESSDQLADVLKATLTMVAAAKTDICELMSIIKSVHNPTVRKSMDTQWKAADIAVKDRRFKLVTGTTNSDWSKEIEKAAKRLPSAYGGNRPNFNNQNTHRSNNQPYQFFKGSGNGGGNSRRRRGGGGGGRGRPRHGGGRGGGSGHYQSSSSSGQ